MEEDDVGKKRSEKTSFDFHPRQNLGCVDITCAPHSASFILLSHQLSIKPVSSFS
jgi:hypothetical protein